ncbi:uncharacterized protein LOC115442351 [Manduca sexta]|uniref:uncharacterized protein LOC115442351 n=1 Tax=Manduca sexta TaxID=7130 RepID=UPI00188F119D|nr:uncharacterized protein LOC115442351 [Manduca sexta]
MLFRWHVVLCALVLLSILDVKSVNGKRSFGGSHSYPRSGGLSGGGSHSNPRSGGLSGGGSQSNPRSGGLSGGGSHSNPRSGGLSGGGSHSNARSGGLSGGGSHSNPTSGGLSGGGSHSYTISGGLSGGGSHSYPISGGLSGGVSHSYPKSGGSHSHLSPGTNDGYPVSGGSSGNGHGSANKHSSGGTHTTNNYNNYHYSPPQQIRYTPVGGGAPRTYPVYRGTPPTYVYQIRDSGSKYGTLLTGLALFNLGRRAYATSRGGSHRGSSGHYQPQLGEVCMFGIKKGNDYEETKINCQLISSFILQEEAKAQNNATNTSIITTTVTNITTVNMTNGVPKSAATTQTPAIGNPIYMKLPNVTLVPFNATVVNPTANVTAPEASSNNIISSSVTVTTTTTNTTVTNALDVKGKPVVVTPGMQCFVMRTTPVSRMKKSIPCGLLQTYAEKSITKSAAGQNAPAFMMLATAVALSLLY